MARTGRPRLHDCGDCGTCRACRAREAQKRWRERQSPERLRELGQDARERRRDRTATGEIPVLGRPTGSTSAPDRRSGRDRSKNPLPLVEGDPFTVEHFAAWCERFLVQYVDQWAGMPLRWEPWQLEFFAAIFERLDDGRANWRSIALCVPRKNGKSTMCAALALYALLVGEGAPEILLAAASDKQAGRMFETCVAFVRLSPDLGAAVHLREYVGEISRIDEPGKILRMASDPSTLHGYNPSLVICDELHAWTKPGHRKAWAALTTGGGARQLTQVVTITTAGNAEERADSILGQLIDKNEELGEIERRDGLVISRNEPARALVFNYSAPTSDPTDVSSMKLANPASWISDEFLARQAANPELTRSEVLQLHGCVWAAGVNAWLTPDVWGACYHADALPPEGSVVFVGIDVGISHDSTGIVISWQYDEERIGIAARVYATDTRASAHIHLPEMYFEVLEDYLRELHATYAVQEFVYDKRFFERSAQVLSDEGLIMVNLEQNSAAMADAYQRFYQAAQEGRLAHAGDPVLTNHVLSTAAVMTDRGWRVSKIKHSRRIDATVAGVMAHYRCEAAPALGGIVFA